MNARVYDNAKSQILDAAEAILYQKGVGSFTVDAVIQESGLSRAGCYYHYKSKEDLLFDVCQRLISRFEKVVDVLVAEDPEPIGRITRSYIKAMMQGDMELRKTVVSLCRIFMEVMLENPLILVGLETRYDGNFYKNLKDEGLCFEQVLLLTLATDGFWFIDSYQMQDMPQAIREKLISYLLKLTYAPIQLDTSNKPKKVK